MPIIREIKYRTVPSGKGERAYREMALGMRNAGETALMIDLSKTELGALSFYSEITHLAIRGGGRKWELDGLPPSLQDLCLLEVELDTLDSLQFLTDLRIFDYRLGNIHQTEGLEKCTALQVLHFLHVPSLKNLQFLQGLKSLEWIKISECMNVERFPNLKSLHSLRRVVVERCQGLVEVSAFTSAPNLEDLIMLGVKSIKPSDFKSIAANKNPKRVLPGIGKLDSHDFLEASKILMNRTTNCYYGGDNEFFEVRHRQGDREFRLKVS